MHRWFLGAPRSPGAALPSAAHSMLSASSGHFCLHTLGGMMGSWSCWRVSDMAWSLRGWVKVEQIRYRRRQRCPSQWSSSERSRWGWAASPGPRLWRIWFFSLTEARSFAQPLFEALQPGCHEVTTVRVTHRCLSQAVWANPGHRPAGVRLRLPPAKTFVLGDHVGLSDGTQNTVHANTTNDMWIFQFPPIVENTHVWLEILLCEWR